MRPRGRLWRGVISRPAAWHVAEPRATAGHCCGAAMGAAWSACRPSLPAALQNCFRTGGNRPRTNRSIRKPTVKMPLPDGYRASFRGAEMGTVPAEVVSYPAGGRKLHIDRLSFLRTPCCLTERSKRRDREKSYKLADGWAWSVLDHHATRGAVVAFSLSM